MDRVDLFTDVMRGLRAHGSLFRSATLTSPWSLDVTQGAPLALCVVLDGSGWIVPVDGAPVEVRVGDVAVVRGGSTLVDALPDEPPCPSTCDASFVLGTYPATSHVNRWLVDGLPAVAKVEGGGEPDAVLEHIGREATTQSPGRQVVLDRLLDWMLVCTLREWFDRAGPGLAPPWWHAQSDPVVGEALRLVHERPDAEWSVTRLAAAVGVSRSTLSARFTDLVGLAPATYLARWRMTLASDLLVEQPHLTLADVARRVGYADAFGFSTAFKRVQGISPAHFRSDDAGRVLEGVGAR